MGLTPNTKGYIFEHDCGGDRWTKHGHDRVYFNDLSQWTDHDGTVWYDVRSDEFKGEGVPDDVLSEIQRSLEEQLPTKEYTDGVRLDEMEVGDVYKHDPHYSDKVVKCEVLELGVPGSEREHADDDDPPTVRVRWLDGQDEGKEGWFDGVLKPVGDDYECHDPETGPRGRILDEKDCRKCGGQGHIPGYEHIDGGRCWRCGGCGVKREYQ